MATIETMQTEVQNAKTLMWSEALTNALGNPRDWEYTGDMAEDAREQAKCSCGHPIRFIFIIRNTITGVKAPLGSTCIDYFEQFGDIYTHLCAAVKEQERKLSEARKAAKKAADEAKVAEARDAYEARYDSLLRRYRDMKERGILAPKPLWIAMASHYRVHRTAPEYQRPCDYLKWYAKQIKVLEPL